MIFAQHGPAWKPKMDRLLERKLIQGVIWDPREESLERISDVQSQDGRYSNLTKMIDLKIYYGQYSNAVLKNLANLEYFPSETINREFLRNSQKIDDLVNKSIRFQNEMFLDVFVSPSLYLQSFNDRNVDKLLSIWEDFSDKINANDGEKKIYISIIIQESALDNTDNINEFMDDLSSFSNKFDGIYLIIDREENSTTRHQFNPTRLLGLMQLIYDLNNLGLEVVVGYSGLESILYFAVGAHAIGTGWFYSLRSFNKVQKGLEPIAMGGRQIKRYTSIGVLQELAIEKHIFSIKQDHRAELYDKILGGCDLDSKIISGNIDAISLNEIYTQYFEEMNNVTNKIIELSELDDRLGFVHEILNNALKNIKIYNSWDPPTKMPFNHINQYSKALKMFAENNFVVLDQ